MVRYLWLWVMLAFMTLSLDAFAIQTSRALPGDTRFHVINYHPDAVHKYVGFYDYNASIIFEKDESIETISLGNPNAWQLNGAGNRLYIKPTADYPQDAITNMLLMTNKRIYHFILEAAEVGEEGIDDPDLVWETRFLYSDDTQDSIRHFASAVGPDLTRPENYNFNYNLAGSDIIAPLRIFDDGKFTYFEFSDVNAELPAFFLVDFASNESLVNYRVMGKYVVVEKVGSRFTLRNGPHITCVFNESKPYTRTQVDNPWWKIW
jgi:type IV secretion system protein VirB9